MAYAVKMTATAVQDLQDISQYFQQTGGDAGATARFLRELQDLCLSLREFPERGSLPRDRILLCQEYRYLVFRKTYLIFYTVDKEHSLVYIKAVVHGARDYSRVVGKI